MRLPATVTIMPRHAVLLLVVILLLVAARAVVDQPLMSVDGAFQTWTAINAFSEGRAIGYEFQSYLGVLMPLALTPFYLLGGASFGASAVVAAVAVIVALFASIWLMVRLAGARGAVVWQATAVLFLLAWVLIPDLASPGVSLRPLRWAAASFVTTAALPLFRGLAERAVGTRHRIVTAALLGLCAALAILWANDVGVPIAIALTGTSALLTARLHGLAAALVVSMTLVAAATMSVALIMTALTHGHLLAWFSYTYVDLPKAQFWYFAPWGERYRVFGLHDLWKIAVTPYVSGLMISSIVALWAAVRIWRRRGPPAVNAAVCCLYASAVGGAILPQIGGHIADQYMTATMLTALVAPLIVVRGRWLRILSFRSRGAAASRGASAAGTGAMFLLAVGNILFLAARAPSVTGYRYLPMLKVWGPPGEQAPAQAFADLGKHFDRMQQPPERRILSDYPSALLIAVRGQAPTAYPSIIHALGPGARDEFVRAIAERRAPFLTIMNPDYNGWTIWNVYSSWPAFRAIFENYQPIARSEQYIIWKARAEPLPTLRLPVTCRASRNSRGMVSLHIAANNPAQPIFVQLDVEFEMTGPGPSRWFWTVSPQTDDPEVRKLYDFSPLYGAPAGPRLTLAAEVGPLKPTARIDLVPTPASAGQTVAQATCRATPTYAVPDYRSLPLLTTVSQLLAPR